MSELHVAHLAFNVPYATRPNCALDFEALTQVCFNASALDMDEISMVSDALRRDLLLCQISEAQDFRQNAYSAFKGQLVPESTERSPGAYRQLTSPSWPDRRAESYGVGIVTKHAYLDSALSFISHSARDEIPLTPSNLLNEGYRKLKYPLDARPDAKTRAFLFSSFANLAKPEELPMRRHLASIRAYARFASIRTKHVSASSAAVKSKKAPILVVTSEKDDSIVEQEDEDEGESVNVLSIDDVPNAKKSGVILKSDASGKERLLIWNKAQFQKAVAVMIEPRIFVGVDGEASIATIADTAGRLYVRPTVWFDLYDETTDMPVKTLSDDLIFDIVRTINNEKLTDKDSIGFFVGNAPSPAFLQYVLKQENANFPISTLVLPEFTSTAQLKLETYESHSKIITNSAIASHIAKFMRLADANPVVGAAAKIAAMTDTDPVAMTNAKIAAMTDAEIVSAKLAAKLEDTNAEWLIKRSEKLVI